MGQAITILASSLSWKTGSQIDYLIKGEIMAVSKLNLIVISILSAITTTLIIIYRGYFFTFAIDENMLNNKQSKKYSILFKFISILKISVSVMYIG